jgi:hypothetical protein
MGSLIKVVVAVSVAAFMVSASVAQEQTLEQQEQGLKQELEQVHKLHPDDIYVAQRLHDYEQARKVRAQEWAQREADLGRKKLDSEVVTGGFLRLRLYAIACADKESLIGLHHYAADIRANDKDAIQRTQAKEFSDNHIADVAVKNGCTLVPVGAHFPINHDQDSVGSDGGIYFKVCFNPTFLWINAWDLAISNDPRYLRMYGLQY